MRWAILLLLAGCMAKSKPVRMPDGREALRVECNYAIDNCKRKARQLCAGSYDELTRGDASCRDCGWELPAEYHSGDSSVWKGVLYVRCR